MLIRMGKMRKVRRRRKKKSREGIGRELVCDLCVCVLWFS